MYGVWRCSSMTPTRLRWQVELFLFDTSGQDMYKPMAAKHVRAAEHCLGLSVGSVGWRFHDSVSLRRDQP